MGWAAAAAAAAGPASTAARPPPSHQQERESSEAFLRRARAAFQSRGGGGGDGAYKHFKATLRACAHTLKEVDHALKSAAAKAGAPLTEAQLAQHRRRGLDALREVRALLGPPHLAPLCDDLTPLWSAGWADEWKALHADRLV